MSRGPGSLAGERPEPISMQETELNNNVMAYYDEPGGGCKRHERGRVATHPTAFCGPGGVG